MHCEERIVEYLLPFEIFLNGWIKFCWVFK